MNEEYFTSKTYPSLAHCDAEVADAGMTPPYHSDDESSVSLRKRMLEIKQNILADYDDSAGYDFDVIEDVTQRNSSVDKGQIDSSVCTSEQKERSGEGDESSLLSATGVSLVDNFNWTEGPNSDPLDNVLERKRNDAFFMTRKIRDLAVIFLLILLLMASTVALTAGFVSMNSEKSQPNGASQSDELGQLEDMMPETQPTEVPPSDTTEVPPNETTEIPPNETTSSTDVPTTDVSSSNTTVSQDPSETTSSGQPSNVPSSAPTVFFECKDSKHEKVYINRVWEYQKCEWLAGEWRAGTRRRVCRSGFEAFDICPVTCGRCSATVIEENEDD